jgi:iodotyrosine deiodinase
MKEGGRRSKVESRPRFVPLSTWQEYPPDEMYHRAVEFHQEMARRRTVRQFSDRPVSREVIQECLRAAGTAPSGANLQPWHFVVVGDPAVKARIRAAAEKEEREFYQGRAPAEWLEALAPLGTDEHKPYLETAPWLIAIFAQRYGISASGRKFPHYYVTESVGIATGFLIAALHHAGLATLTHTPSPMGFLNDVLERPAVEKPFLLLVVGYPASDAEVPRIGRKSLEEVSTFIASSRSPHRSSSPASPAGLPPPSGHPGDGVTAPPGPGSGHPR